MTNTIQHDVYKSINQRVSANIDFTINGDATQDVNEEEEVNRSSESCPRSNRVSAALVNSITSFMDEENMIPDEQATACYKCYAEFSFLFRRHHCKICRKVFCKNCSLQSELEIDGVRAKIRACK